MNGGVRITKVDDEAPSTKPPVVLPMVPAPPAPPTAGKRKSMKTFPRGILKTKKAKIKAVADPAKAPPLKKTMKKQTIRLITDKGMTKQRKTIKRKLAKMSDQKVKQLAIKSGLAKSQDIPAKLAREMVEGGMIAGFVSAE